MKIRPELGYLTSMAMGTDRNWMVAGTNRGYLALWDVRYGRMVKLYQHSARGPIHRLATCYTRLPQDSHSSSGSSRPYVFVAGGKNEASIFDVSTGECRQCFRMLGTEYPSFVVPNRPCVASQYLTYSTNRSRLDVRGLLSAPKIRTSASDQTPQGSA